VAVVVVVVAADSPFQNCYLDPSSLPHRVAAVEVPFPVEVDDSVHWYWLVPFFLSIVIVVFQGKKDIFFQKRTQDVNFSFRITKSGPFSS